MDKERVAYYKGKVKTCKDGKRQSNKDLMSGIGARVRELRKKKGFTQKQFGEVISVGREVVANIELENNGLTLPNLIMICIAFGQSADSILGLDNYKYE